MSKKTVAKAADEPRHLRAEVARQTGYAASSLVTMERLGAITPARGPGNCRLYSDSDIKKLIERRARTIPAQQPKDGE
jgi:hypothetical protein